MAKCSVHGVEQIKELANSPFLLENQSYVSLSKNSPFEYHLCFLYFYVFVAALGLVFLVLSKFRIRREFIMGPLYWIRLKLFWLMFFMLHLEKDLMLVRTDTPIVRTDTPIVREEVRVNSERVFLDNPVPGFIFCSTLLLGIILREPCLAVGAFLISPFLGLPECVGVAPVTENMDLWPDNGDSTMCPSCDAEKIEIIHVFRCLYCEHERCRMCLPSSHFFFTDLWSTGPPVYPQMPIETEL